jgi:hypothetical protein
MRILNNSHIKTLPNMTTNIKCPFLLLFLSIYHIITIGENNIVMYKVSCEIPTKKSFNNDVLGKFNISMTELSKYTVRPVNVIKVNIIKDKNKNDQDAIICHLNLYGTL